MATNIITPIIHLNGDSFRTLTDQLEHAYEAVCAAEKALRAAAPNARNFYPDPGRYERALAQHRTRLGLLAELRESFEAEVTQLYDETHDAARHRSQRAPHRLRPLCR